jgi:putative tryptophan/tyrosine transport system substrate-binding protein
MRRREFITGLIGTTAASALRSHVAFGQAGVPIIGYLSSQPSVSVAHLEIAFRQGLNEFGYFENRNVSIEYRYAEQDYERLPALALELVRRPVDVLVACGNVRAVLAAKSTTATIPIVFDANEDPVTQGLVASINRPGGNLTGVSFFTSTLEGKRLALLHDISPNARVIGNLTNPDNPNLQRDAEIQRAASALGLKLHMVEAKNGVGIDAAFATMASAGAEALLVNTDSFLTGARNQIVAQAARYAIPAIYGRREFATAGGLISYGESLAETYRQMGIYAGKILKGARPSELPVMQLTKIELVLNLKAAKALGLTVPETLLATADEVIQ